MKKTILIFFMLILIPTKVNAETKYLYDVLKEEAENEGLAIEYIDEHHDSYTKEPTHKIYHWYATSTDEGNAVKEKNNVIFANFCWQIVRTTDTGGVKLIYNGVPENGECNATGEDTQIGKTNFNDTKTLPLYAGYMYNQDAILNHGNDAAASGSIFGTGVSYSNGTYTLTNTNPSMDDTHHYTCNNTTGSCQTVRYYYYKTSSTQVYVELSGGKDVEQALKDMINSDKAYDTNSTVKDAVDTWYEEHMTDYTFRIEDTIYCNDKTTTEIGGWDPSEQLTKYMRFAANTATNKNLLCSNPSDQFSMANEIAHLEYPVGLLSAQEARLSNNDKTRSTSAKYWILSPKYFSGNFIDMGAVETWGGLNSNVNGSPQGIRPVISMIEGTKISEGEGTKTSPYIINDLAKNNIVINNESEGNEITISNTTNVAEESVVVISVAPKEGYVLSRIEIVDSNNQSIEYESISENEYSFIMPNSQVTITPIFKTITNPKTSNNFGTLLLILSSVIVCMIVSRVRNNKVTI